MNKPHENSELGAISKSDLIKRLKLRPLLTASKSFKTYKVKKSCALRELVPNLPGVKVWRGNAYYELTDEEEDISEDKKLIIQKTVGHSTCIDHFIVHNSFSNCTGYKGVF